MNKVLISDFLDNEYSQTALYSSYRSIGNYIDGLKSSSRKVVYSVKKKRITDPVKVSRLASDVPSATEYLHGETSLQMVIANMAQDFVGSNNMSLLSPDGSFGTRFIPVPAAARYLFTKKSTVFDSVFSPMDDPVLISQEFEGTEIEPRYFVPTIPMILVNGSEGIGTGFAQKILPRNKAELLAALTDYINSGATERPLQPYFEGFRGRVQALEDNGSWAIYGRIEVKDITTIEIKELPIGYNLSSYTKVLDRLVENGDIKSYEDLSLDDEFYFVVKASKAFVDQDEESLYSSLKLIKRVTENYTCIDENNSIREFNSVQEILLAYHKIRKEYYKKQKSYRIKKMKADCEVLSEQARFIREVVDNRLAVMKVKKVDLYSILENYQEPFKKKDDSYDYLLNMPIYSLTYERYQELTKRVAAKKKEITVLEKTTLGQMWQDDLDNLSELW